MQTTDFVTILNGQLGIHALLEGRELLHLVRVEGQDSLTLCSEYMLMIDHVHLVDHVNLIDHVHVRDSHTLAVEVAEIANKTVRLVLILKRVDNLCIVNSMI